MHHLELAVGPGWCADTDQHQIDPIEPRLDTGPADQPPSCQPGLQEILDLGFDHGRATGADRLHLGRVDVDPVDVMPVLQQAGRRRCPDIAEPQNRDMQDFSSPFQGVAALDEHACGFSKFSLSIKQAVCHAHRTPLREPRLPTCQRIATADITLTRSNDSTVHILAIDQVSPSRPTVGLGWLSWAAYHLLSLETLLVLFLYGRYLKNIMPATPVTETVFYGALSVAVGVWIILRHGIYLRGLPIVVAGLVFTGWMVASYGWSPSRTLARESLVFVLGINLWALFAAACIVAGSRERVMRLLLLIVLVTAAIAFTGAYIEIVHGSFRFYRGAAENWDPRTYLIWGSIVSTGAAIAMAIAVHSRFGSLKQLVAATILCVSFFFVMTSGARGASLAIVTAALLAFFVHRPRIHDGRIEIPKTQIVVVAIVALLVAYVAYLLTTGQTTSTLGRFLRLFNESDDPLLRRGANRFDYFSGAYRAWLDSPLLGQGLYGFAIFFCGYEQPGCYPHNAVLHILADFGLVGLVLFLFFIMSGVRYLNLSRLLGDPLMFTLTMAFATVFFHVMVASDTTTYYPLFFFLGLLALRPPSDLGEYGTVQDPDPGST